MRRVITAAAALAVVAVATVALCQRQVGSHDHVRAQALGATMERASLADWTAEFSMGAVATTPSRHRAGLAPHRASGVAAATTSRPTSALTTTSSRVASSPPTTVAPVVAPPSVLSADGAATSTPAPVVTAPPQRAGTDLVTRAVGLVHFDWRDSLPGWSIQFVGPRAGMRGATFPAAKVVQVYVRSDESVADVAHAFAHELGHAIDVTYMDGEGRAEFNVARGRSAAFDWWVAPGADDFSSGAGDWAECFAWTMTQGVGGFYSRLGGPPSAAVMQVIAQLDH